MSIETLLEKSSATIALKKSTGIPVPAMTPPVFEEINGQKLTLEQKLYLEGLFAGLRNRGLSFGDVESNPVESEPKPKPDENVTAEERIKQELHPLDAYSLLLENAAANGAPE